MQIFRSPRVSATATIRRHDLLLIGMSFSPEARDGDGHLARLDRKYGGFGFSIVDMDCTMSFPYPVQEAMQAIGAVAQFASSFRRVVTYGSSVGAFTTLRFAADFGAQAAIASSPQVAWDPQKVPFEDRWMEHRSNVTNYQMDNISAGLTSLNELYVLYDPTGNDKLHVAGIERINPKLVRMPIPYADHQAARVLNQGNTLGELISAIVEERLQPGDFRKALKESRPQSPLYLKNLAAAQPARRDALRVRLLEMANTAKPSIATQLEMIPTLVRLGRLEDARLVAQSVLDTQIANERQLKTLQDQNTKLKKWVSNLKKRVEVVKEAPTGTNIVRAA